MPEKPANYNLPFVAEEHVYQTRSTTVQHLNPDLFRINTPLSDVINGMAFPRPYVKKQTNKQKGSYLKELYSDTIFLVLDAAPL